MRYRNALTRASCGATGLVAFVAGIAATIPAGLAAAQDQRPGVCMRGTFLDVEQVPAEQRNGTYEVLVAPVDEATLAESGLVPIKCPQRLRSAAGRVAARDDVCRFAYLGNEAVQEQMRRALGVHPALLCRSAELVAGPWQGRKIDLSPDDLERPPQAGH